MQRTHYDQAEFGPEMQRQFHVKKSCVTHCVGQGSVINNRVLVAAESRKSPDRVLSGSQSVDRAGERPQPHKLLYSRYRQLLCYHRACCKACHWAKFINSTLSQARISKRTMVPATFGACITYFSSHCHDKMPDLSSVKRGKFDFG